MATFDSIFPNFLTMCGNLHTLLLSVAFALFIVGVIATVQQRASHKSILNLLLRLLLLTSMLVFLPAWGNTLQNLLQTSILSGLGVDPSQVYQQFNQLLVIKRDPSTQSSWWNVMSQLNSFTTDLIVSAVLMLVGWLASLMMFWAYIFQTIILNLGYALSPLLIGFMAIPALKHTGNRYLTNLVGVLLWPLGWALAALVTQGILDFMTDPSFQYIDPTSTATNLQRTIGVAAVGFWIIFSTIAAPVIIDPAGTYYLSPLLQFSEARDMHIQQAELATMAFLERNPKDFDNADLLKLLFLKSALGKAQDERLQEAVEFRAKQLHQKAEIGRIDILATRDNEVLAAVTGQIIRSGIFQDKAFTEVFSFTLRLRLIRNPNMALNGRFPTAVGDFKYEITK